MWSQGDQLEVTAAAQVRVECGLDDSGGERERTSLRQLRNEYPSTFPVS